MDHFSYVFLSCLIKASMRSAIKTKCNIFPSIEGEFPRGESISCILIAVRKIDFAAKYFASQESRNDFYFLAAKYFASGELFASCKSENIYSTL